MKELFGISTDTIMVALLIIFGMSLACVAWIFLTNRVMFKMGLRNLGRRKLQTGLTVLGLMLATLIITAAFTTGDTIDYSVSNAAYDQWQRIDLNVNLQGDDVAETDAPPYLDAEATGQLEQRFQGDAEIEAFLPFLFEPVPATNERTRLSEPTVVLSGIDPERLQSLGGLRLIDGGSFDVTTLGPTDALVNERAARALDAAVGDTIVVHGTSGELRVTVVGIAEEERATGNLGELDDSGRAGGIVMPLATVQDLTGRESLINFLGVALQGGVRDTLPLSDGAAARVETFIRSDAAEAVFGPANARVTVDTVKLDDVEDAEKTGNLFVSFFIIFGLFSIAAGVMLIFLIFVMLAAERKAEMGMARAVGAQRTSLVQSFLSEGVAYNLLAGAIGCALGVGASVMLVVGLLRWSLGDDFDFITTHVTARSLIISYCLGAVITFLTVVVASIKVSGVNIVAAIRNTPEDEGVPAPRSISWRWVALSLPAMVIPPLGLWVLLRKGLAISWAWIFGTAGVALGALCILMARGNGSEMLFSFGFSIIPLSIAVIAAHHKVSARLTWTVVGLFLAAYWLSPVNLGEKLLGRELDGDIEMFFLSGMMVVIAFTLIIVFNARLLTSLVQQNESGKYRTAVLAALAAIAIAVASFLVGDAGDGFGELGYIVAALFGAAAAFAFMSAQFPAIAPALKMGVAYPLSNRFRTGMTIAMFSLIIFSLTVFSAVNANFSATTGGADSDGGWDVVASANRNGELGDIQQQLRAAGSGAADDIQAAGRVTTVRGDQQVRESGEEALWAAYPVIAADDDFLSMPESVLEARADGYDSDRAALDAVRAQENLALLDASVTTDEGNGTYDWKPDLGVKDGSFEPFSVEFRDAETSAAREVTVVGILASKIDDKMASGLYVNERSFAEVYGDPVYERAYVRLNGGVGAASAARDIEASLSVAGVQADSIRELLDDASAQDRAFTRMFQVFMMLGLFVGVAALGVIAFRSVVERRQQIGMLRAIGYQSNTVALTFVLESGFIALMGILSGVVGGAVVSHNLFTTGQFSEANIEFAMPWMEVFIFAAFAAVVSLAMTWWPSRRAAGVPVADALRYE